MFITVVASETFLAKWELRVDDKWITALETRRRALGMCQIHPLARRSRQNRMHSAFSSPFAAHGALGHERTLARTPFALFGRLIAHKAKWYARLAAVC